MTLEQAIAYIQDDELVEVTPKSIRLRKRLSRSARAQEGGTGGRLSSSPSPRRRGLLGEGDHPQDNGGYAEVFDAAPEALTRPNVYTKLYA